MFRTIRLAGLALALTFVAAPASAAVFIKLDDINGESPDSDHAGWVDLLGWSTALTRPVSSDSGRSSGAVTWGEITVTKRLDRATVPAIERLVTGAAFAGPVNIDVVDDATRLSSLYITLDKVILTDYQVTAQADGVPTESFSLNYERILFEYFVRESSGTVSAIHRFGWDLKNGTEFEP